VSLQIKEGLIDYLVEHEIKALGKLEGAARKGGIINGA